MLTSALWRFLVGPILPLTVQDGTVEEVGTAGGWIFLVKKSVKKEEKKKNGQKNLREGGINYGVNPKFIV